MLGIRAILQKIAPEDAIDSRWRNRSEFINARDEVIAFLSCKWATELDYGLIKKMWASTRNRIAVRFAYEWPDDPDHWYRSYGDENWEFNDYGLMLSGMPPSTTCRFWLQIASTAGRSDTVLTNIPG